MRVLLTGHRGYIGSVLSSLLVERGYDVIGYDTGYYRGCELYPWDPGGSEIQKDIRDASARDLDGIEAIIHLAALSNDPLGELDSRLTDQINRDATIRLARLAKEAGVKRFVYASSQSMYGVSDTDAELDEETSEKNPVTAYARTKWEAEEELRRIADQDFVVVCMRPSTIFGASPMLRSDIIFNNLVGCAYTTGKIEIKSDGTPWRPVVHVRDASQAFIAGLEAPPELVNGQAFNVGILNGNFTVQELAEAARRAVPGSEIVFTGEHGRDSRTYRVSFNKILSVLKDYYRPEWDLDRGAREMIELFDKIGFTGDHLRARFTNRLLQIRYLLDKKQTDKNLRWY